MQTPTENCPICLEAGQPVLMKYPCGHTVCEGCYHAGDSNAGSDPACPSAVAKCPTCRHMVMTKTRHGCATALERLVLPARKRSRLCPGTAGSASAKRCGSGARRKKPKHATAKAAKQCVHAAAEDGGFTLEARGRVRASGELVPVGTTRTCLPDALWVVLWLTSPDLKLELEQVRMALDCGPDTDPTAAMALEYASRFGLTLEYERALKGSPAGLFRRTQGAYLVRLEIVCDGGTDWHYVAYNAVTGRLIDNEPGAKVPLVNNDDRVSTKRAIKVFRQYFPNAKKIYVDAVHVAKVNK